MVELSRPLPLATVGAAGRVERIEASASERAALAARYGIPSIERLSATLHLTEEADGAVLVRGAFEAALVQTCVVSLEPVAQELAEPVLWRLLPAGREPDDGPDDPDEIPTAGFADLGEALAEQLSLSLDPYPRAPDAEVPETGGAAAAGAFAALGRLRRDG